MQQYVVGSDDAWAVIVLESPERCGKPCEDMAQILNTVAEKSVGLVNFATVRATESVADAASGDSIEVHKLLNITTVPSIALYGPGPKTLRQSMQLDSQMSGGLFGGGPKVLYQNLKMFTPSLIQSVRAATLDTFLGRPSTPASLPRVLLLTDKKERSLLYKKLSIDFAARAVFGQAALDDAKGKLAAAFGVNASAQAAAPAAASGAAKASGGGSTLLVSPPGPHVVSADVLKKLPPGAFSWPKYEGQMTYAALYEHLDAHLPRAPVVQLRSQADFNAACGTAPDVTLCFIAVLPHEAEAAALAAGTFPAAEELEHCEAADAGCFRRRRRVSGFEDAGDDDEEADRDEAEDDADDERAVAKRKLQAGARVYRALQKLAGRSYIRVDWVS